MKILQLRAENVKRLSVVEITPIGNLVEITGANGEGKTSVLDSIWMALGGKDAAPEKPIRKGSKTARVEVQVGDQNGVQLIIERTFTDKGSYLTVKGGDGAKYASPQKMLDALMGAIGFDPLAFMRLDGKEKFEMLRHIVKLEVDIDALDRKRATVYEQRTELNRDLAKAKARADAIIVPDDLPDEMPDRSAIADRLASAAERNAALDRAHSVRQRARENLASAQAEIQRIEAELATAKKTKENWEAEIEKLKAEALPEAVDVTALRAELAKADQLAEGFRRQKEKIEATGAATTLERQADEKTAEIQGIDLQKREALAKAKMPIEGLGFDDGIVTFNGLPLDQASASQQLRISTAIGAALNPKLRVILARDGSLLDSKSLQALGAFADENDMQIWLERVDESGKVGIVMEDGHVRGQEALVAEHEKAEKENAEKEPAAHDPGGDAADRARAYLDSMIRQLDSRKTQAECESDDAAVVVKLARFPNMISTEWKPAYLARMKKLAGK